MSTKRKKATALLLSLLAVVLLLAILCGVWFQNPHCRYRPKNTDTVDSVEFPIPDSVVYVKNFHHQLTGQDQQTLIAAFAELFRHLESADAYLGVYSLRSIREDQREDSVLEYRYETRQRYTGRPKNAPEWTYPHYGNVVMDAIQVNAVARRSMPLVTAENGKYTLRVAALIFTEEAMTAYRETVREVLSHYDFEKPDWLTE